VFGAYHHTNNQMMTHGYKRKTSKQFLDFIKMVEQNHDSNTKQEDILVLDGNTSIQKSNMVKQNISRNNPRIQLVFLPTRSPQHNLIEVRRWLVVDS
jgi:transposase